MQSPITIKPRMSEKTYALSQNRVYVFDVPLNANKHQIAEVIEKTYDVKIELVRTVVVKGKPKQLYRNRRMQRGKRSDIKKAYVTLTKGQSIPIFAGVEEENTEVKADEKQSKKSVKKANKEDK